MSLCATKWMDSMKNQLCVIENGGLFVMFCVLVKDAFDVFIVSELVYFPGGRFKYTYV